MKPNFALDISQQGLSLLRRAKGGWQIIGSVSLDDADLATKLGYLRKTAAELASGQLASKLVIPNSEILYRRLEAPGLTDQEREKSVVQALEGTTPYAVAELAFDWTDAGDGMVHVAAVARETLEEAKKFAVEHRFNPVCFVSIPEEGAFVGEPFFGETNLCATVLPEGEALENDPGPIIIVSDHDPSSAPTPVDIEAHLSDTTAEDMADAVLTELNTQPDIHGNADDATHPGTDQQPSAFSSNRTGQQNTSTTSTTGAELSQITARFALYPDKARAIQDAETDAEDTPAVADPQVPDTAGPGRTMPASPITYGNQRIVLRNPVPGPPRAPLVPLGHQSPQKPSVFETSQPTKPPSNKKLVAMTLALGLTAMILLAVLVSSVFFDSPISSTRLLTGFDRSAAVLAPEDLSAPQIVATAIDPPGATLPSQFDQPITPQQQAPLQPTANGDAGTPFIATSTAGSDPTLQLATLSPPDQPLNPAQALGESELAESTPDAHPPGDILGDISVAEAVVIEASTGVWVLAPIPPVDLEAEELDDFYVASIDPMVLGHDAIALPSIDNALNDHRLGQFAAPAPAGTLFDLDERGFVRATAKGAVSADGVLIFSGAPKIKPPIRPFSSEVLQTASIAAPSIPKTRPTLRPANLVENFERTALGGRTRSELAAIRPRPRPASPQQSAAAADFTPTKLAVLKSRRPTPRSSGFATVVASSRAASQAAAATQTAAVVAAPAAPIIPTTASVAREATISNAINLAQVNLIGVYGSSSARRALIRLRNGRYLKVQIGDRLDGGKVAAIEGNRLQYIKAGRMVTLDIAS